MASLFDYQALLFDIDGTLIPPSREVFPEIPLLLQELAKKNIRVGLCSGRGYPSILNVLIPIFPDNSVHVLAGGSVVISNSGKVLWQESISARAAADLQQVILDTNSIAIFVKPDKQYAQDEVLENIKKHPWKQAACNLQEMTPDDVCLVYVVRPNQEVKKFIQSHPELSCKCMPSSNGYEYYEITARGITKARGLNEWSTITKIPTSKIIGFGDSQNDVEFLQNCGFAVAMENADTEIKNLATRTIGLVSEKGLPLYLQSIIEGNLL